MTSPEISGHILSRDAFAIIEEADKALLLPLHVKSILLKQGYSSLRLISALNIEKIEKIELKVRQVFGKADRIKDKSVQQLKEEFGEAFAEDTGSFEFLPGERDAIQMVADMARRILLKFDRENKVKKRKNEDVNNNNVVSVDEPVKKKRSIIPRKSLSDYVKNWLHNTSQKFDFEEKDFQVDVQSKHFKCLKCGIKPIKVYEASGRGESKTWKISNFATHLRCYHQSTFFKVYLLFEK